MKDILDTRTYQLEDQRRFAALSGDANPIHLDPIVAASYDFRDMPARGPIDWLGKRAALIGDALAVFFASDDRMIRVYGRAEAGLGKPPASDEFVEIVATHSPQDIGVATANR